MRRQFYECLLPPMSGRSGGRIPIDRKRLGAADRSHRLRTSAPERKPVFRNWLREAVDKLLDELLRQPRPPQGFNVALNAFGIPDRETLPNASRRVV